MITPPPGVRTPDRRSGFPVPLPVAPTACGNGKWEAAVADGRLSPRRCLHPLSSPCFPFFGSAPAEHSSCTSSPRFQEGSGGVARGVERSETTPATPGRRPERCYLPEPSRFAGSNQILPVPQFPWRAPGTDTCPGGTAATDAQWGDRAFERQYRDRMGLRWARVFACTINRRAWHGADQREVHDARRTKMVRRY